MIRQEAVQIGQWIREFRPRVVVNLGSSTPEYNYVTQPHIGSLVLDPLYFDRCCVLNVDQKDGADLRIDGTETGLPSRFADMVLCCSLLEHTLQPEEAIAHCSRLVKADGLVVFSVPAEWPNHLDPIDTGLRVCCREAAVRCVGRYFTVEQFVVLREERGSVALWVSRLIFLGA
jgi:SAM-dependent methyltransferase